MNKLQKLSLMMGMSMALNSDPFDYGYQKAINQLSTKPFDWDHTHFFDSKGHFMNTKDEHTVFSCKALNDKNAIRKYQNWLKMRSI